MNLEDIGGAWVTPAERDADTILPADSYPAGSPVWVWRHETSRWHPGVVQGTGRLAVMVRYRATGQRGEVIDTVMPDQVAVRATQEQT